MLRFEWALDRIECSISDYKTRFPWSICQVIGVLMLLVQGSEPSANRWKVQKKPYLGLTPALNFG